MLTVLRRLCGHASGGPSGVFAQSISRIRAPISPPPARNVRVERPGPVMLISGVMLYALIVVTSSPLGQRTCGHLRDNMRT